MVLFLSGQLVQYHEEYAIKFVIAQVRTVLQQPTMNIIYSRNAPVVEQVPVNVLLHVYVIF